MRNEESSKCHHKIKRQSHAVLTCHPNGLALAFAVYEMPKTKIKVIHVQNKCFRTSTAYNMRARRRCSHRFQPTAHPQIASYTEISWQASTPWRLTQYLNSRPIEHQGSQVFGGGNWRPVQIILVLLPPIFINLYCPERELRKKNRSAEAQH